MKRFYTAIVRRRRLVLAVFALAAVLSVFAVRQVKVDYDINDYLPPESPSTTAIEVMNGAFTGGIPNMRVMVRDVTVPQALEYKEKLAAIDGVSSVAWLDDSLDVTVPLQMQDTATVESYYKDGCALFACWSRWHDLAHLYAAESRFWRAGRSPAKKVRTKPQITFFSRWRNHRCKGVNCQKLDFAA